jgi:hypothetical protein
MRPFGLVMAYATATGGRSLIGGALLVVGGAVLFEVGVEGVQAPLPDRYFSYGDMLANALGATLGGGLVSRRIATLLRSDSPSRLSGQCPHFWEGQTQRLEHRLRYPLGQLAPRPYKLIEKRSVKVQLARSLRE